MIKKKIITYRTNRNEKNRNTTSVDFSSCKSIGIIIHEKFENEANINELISNLKDNGKTVSKIYFVKKPMGHLMSPWFKSSHINIFGQVKSPELEHFLGREYDFLLNLDESGHYLLDYLLSKSKAKSRVGIMHPDRSVIYEMMIQASNQIPASKEVLKYLKMISSK